VTTSEQPPPDTRASLGTAAARGALASVAGQAGRVVVQFAGLVVLARLLDPHDYGLLAVSLVVIGVGEIVRDFGLTTAAVQAPTLSPQQRSTLLWINASIGAAGTIIVFTAAPLVHSFYDDPHVVPMLRALAFTFLVNGFATQYRANLMREIRLGVLAACDLAGQTVGVIAAVVAAAAGAGYWSLVLLLLAQYGAVLVLLVALSRWLPGRPRRAAGLGKMVRFGGHIVATQLIYYLGNNLDVLTISVRFTPTSLGIYNRAFALVMAPLNQIRTPASNVAVPVLSRLEGDYVTAGRYLERAQLALGYVVGPALALCAGASGAVVELMLGHRWAEAAPIVAMLAVAGACSILAYVGLWTYLSRGMGAQLMRYTLLTLVLQAVCILVGSQWGVRGVAAGYLTAAVLEWPLSLYWLSRRTVLPVASLYAGALRITVVSTAVGLAALLGCRLVPNPIGLGALGLAVLLALVALGLCAVLLAPVRRDLRDVRQLAGMIRRRASPGRAAAPRHMRTTG
jgi:O-antigen/teichoic acid export membrane protein